MLFITSLRLLKLGLKRVPQSKNELPSRLWNFTQTATAMVDQNPESDVAVSESAAAQPAEQGNFLTRRKCKSATMSAYLSSALTLE